MPLPILFKRTMRCGMSSVKGSALRDLASKSSSSLGVAFHKIKPALVLSASALAISAIGLSTPISSSAIAAEQEITHANYRILPPDFFGQQPLEAADNVVLNADHLSYDSATKIVTARHNVELFYQGYAIQTDKLVYDQTNDRVFLVGNVRLKDLYGNIYVADKAELTNNFKSNFVQSMIVQVGNEGLFQAKSAETQAPNKQLFKDAIYSPCQECVQNGQERRGWRIKAASILRDGDEQMLYLEDATLEVLGVPIAWLPLFALPDPLAKRKTGFLPAVLSYEENLGFGVKVPYFWALHDSYDLTFTPTYHSKQGFFGDVEWRQAFRNGEYNIRMAGIQQNDPNAFSGEPGDRDLRGGIMSSGEFRIVPTVRVGWDVATSTDRTFFKDYDLNITDATGGKSEIYAEHLAPNSYFLAQAQDFVKRDVADASEVLSQPTVLPKLRGSLHQNSDIGELALEGSAIAVSREADHIATAGGVTHALGLEGTKLRGTLEGSWRQQAILDGGLVITPIVGLRADAASYDGGSSNALAPGEDTLVNLSPVAAFEARLPLISMHEKGSVLLEPIFQIVARPDGEYAVGITNEESVGFVLDDTNIFDINRLSGFDRVETGIWTNYGVTLTANFDSDKWLRATIGQARHLAGKNVFDQNDHAQSAFGDGFDGDTSNIVAGITGAPTKWLRLGAKVSVTPDDFEVERASSAVQVQAYGFDAAVDYAFVEKEAALGLSEAQHQVSANIGVPLAEYVKARASLTYDLSGEDLTSWDAGLFYDDDYAAFGFTVSQKSNAFDPEPDDLRFNFSFDLRQLGKGDNTIDVD